MKKELHTRENLTEAETQQTPFQWEAPVLYTEDWLETLGGTILSLQEDSNFHT